MAAATGAQVRAADQLMDQLAVPAQGDLVGQFTRGVPLPPRPGGLPGLFRRHLTIRPRLADDRLSCRDRDPCCSGP